MLLYLPRRLAGLVELTMVISATRMAKAGGSISGASVVVVAAMMTTMLLPVAMVEASLLLMRTAVQLVVRQLPAAREVVFISPDEVVLR